MTDHDHYLGAIMSCHDRAPLHHAVLERWPGWSLTIDSTPTEDGNFENFCHTFAEAHRLASAADQPWSLLVQDDIHPLPGLLPLLPDFLASAPTDTQVATFCSFQYGKDRHALKDGTQWRARAKSETPCVWLVAIRTPLVLDIIAEVLCVDPEEGTIDDWRLKLVLNRYDLPAYTHIPSLAQHDEKDGRSSVMGHRWLIFGHPWQCSTYPEGLTARQVLNGWIKP